MATPSTRESVLTQILERVSSILVDNGYATDAGATVFFGEAPELGADDPTSAVALLVRDDAPSDEGGVVRTVLPVDVVALARADQEQPWTTVEAVITDIKRAIETVDRTFCGLLIRELARGRTRSLPRDGGGTTVGAAIEYRATFIETWGAT